MLARGRFQLTTLQEKNNRTEGERLCAEDATTATTGSSDLLAPHSSPRSDEMQQQERLCSLCGKTISPMEERFKPCSCEAAEVHTLCAVKEGKWLPRNCAVCERAWQNPPQQPCELTPAKLLPDRVQVCFICGTSTTRPRSGLRIDAKMVRPCFCDVTCHHGCMVEHLQTTKVCKVCGATYNYIEYGSLKDFFVRYWCQYFASFVALVLLFLLSALALTNSLRKVDTFSLARLFILIIGIVLFGLCLIFTWMCVKYTVMRRIPRFHARYRQITVLDYEPRQTPQFRRSFAEESKFVMPGQEGGNSAEQGLLKPDFSTSHLVSSTPIGGSQVFRALDVETVGKI